LLRIPPETAKCEVPCVNDGCESQVNPGAGVVPLRAAPPCGPFHVKQQRALLLSQMLIGKQEDPLQGDVSTPDRSTSARLRETETCSASYGKAH